MRSKSLKCLVAVLALAALVIPSFAKPLTKMVTLTGPQKIAGKELREGDYKFKVDDNKVVVEFRNKVIAEASGKWEPRDTKWEADSFVSGSDGQVQEIRFAGEKRSFVIGSM